MDDKIKFDKINAFNFIRKLPEKRRLAIISNGRSWGFGKRKKARVLASVKPGTGKVEKLITFRLL